MAQILTFPNGAAAPVQQQRGPGRHPRMVVQLSQWRRSRRASSAHGTFSSEFLAGMAQGRAAAEHHLALAASAAPTRHL